MTPQEYFRKKTPLPTELRTREFARLPLWIKEQSFFMAGVMRAEALNTFRQAAQGVIDGTVSEQEALRIIREGLKASGYKPEPGQEGTIKDLNSVHRQMINLQTNVALSSGWMQEAQQRNAGQAFPAKELIRGAAVEDPRNWSTIWPDAVAKSGSRANPDRMAALLDDPVWLFLSDFGSTYDPLKWGSAMVQTPVGFRKAKEWGLVRQGEPAPKPQPIPSLNSTLQVQSKITDPKARKSVEDEMMGLAAWDGNAIVFTDPNGSKPWPVSRLTGLLRIDNVDGTENYQKRALREWVALGGDSRAIAKMAEEFAGTDLLDDWNMLVRRVAFGEKAKSAADVVTALKRLAEGVLR